MMFWMHNKKAFNNLRLHLPWWNRLRHSSGPQSVRNSWCSSSHSEQAGKSVEAPADDVPPNRHVAKSHDDTSEGAVHCFQAEFGVHISVLDYKFVYLRRFLLYASAGLTYLSFTYLLADLPAG